MTDVITLPSLDLALCANQRREHLPCRHRHSWWDRNIAESRGIPRLCWTCQREEEEKSRSPLTALIAAPRRPPTVVRGFQPDPEGPQAA